MIRELGSDDVPALIACIRRCYGDSYTEHEFYDAGFLRSELRSGRLLSAGALAASKVVAHVATKLTVRGDAVADTVGGIVDPEWRGAGLMRKVGAQMSGRYAELGIKATMHYATGAHDRTQRLISSSGGVATGVLLGHLAANTLYRGIEHDFADARIGVVVYFQAYNRLEALKIYLPARYAERVGDVYDQAGLDRRVVPVPHTSVSSRSWIGTVHHDARRAISSFQFGSLAGDRPRPATELLSGAMPQCEEVAYADVPIADSRSSELISVLEDYGFFFGAIRPGTAESEAIRFQRVASAAVAPSAIKTASPGGRSLLGWITQEYARTRSS